MSIFASQEQQKWVELYSRGRINTKVIFLSMIVLLSTLHYMGMDVESSLFDGKKSREPLKNPKGNVRLHQDKSEMSKHIISPSTSFELIPSSYDGSFDGPGWQCSSNEPAPSPKHKLFFVHVFKTAGSTFRVFFDNYAKKCGKGISTLIHCSQLDHGSINTTDPYRNWTSPCEIEKTITRNQTITHVHDTVTRTKLQDHMDIAIGHYSVGIHENLIDTSTKEAINPQYVAFFREPYAHYVSGTLFHAKDDKLDWSFEDAVEAMKSEIREYHQKKKQLNYYYAYLTTPEQKEYERKKKEETKRNRAIDEEMVQLIKKNVIDFHIAVGVVEYMSDSLELIQSLIDVNRDLTDDFKSLLKPPQASDSLVKNQSKLSSSKIVKALKEDEEIFKMWTEMMRHEIEIYEFALQVHQMQMKALRKKHGNRFSLVETIST